MNVRFTHFNYHVADMERSVDFYTKALGLKVSRQFGPPSGEVAFTIMTDGESSAELELMWRKDHPQAYEKGERSFHFCIETEDFEVLHAIHKSMGCIYEEKGRSCYFIEDPDGYLVEIMKKKNTDRPDYLYNPEKCPCPRGAQANCPRYRNCDACIINHRNSPTAPLTACERKAEKEK
ncbi:MAG: VOC family protein [Solobacterium sp.]|nr:VOC family protein [Solobacterium sp.]